MNKKDYYEVLGVAKSANADEIKRAYRQAAMKFHPDRNKEDGAETKFKEASEAYEVLSDDEKRSRYDRFGHNGPSVSQSRVWDISDIFRGFWDFESHKNQRTQQRTDAHAKVSISLEEVALGCQKIVSFQRSEYCTRCNEEGGERESCKNCNGVGYLQNSNKNPSGFYVDAVTCSVCKGSGSKLLKACKKCKGKGFSQAKTEVKVAIPPGVRHGDLLRADGFGHVHNQGRSNLICEISVLPHDKFLRKNNDLLLIHKIGFAAACIGSKIDLTTIYGQNISVDIPAGTQFGQTFRVRGCGLPLKSKSNHKGDLLITVEIMVPTKISAKAKELLIQFDAIATLESN